MATILSMFVRICYNLYPVGTSKIFIKATYGINPFSAIVAKNEEEQKAYWPNDPRLLTEAWLCGGLNAPDLTVKES